MKKKFLKFTGVILSIVFVLFCTNINYSIIFNMPQSVYMTLDELNVFNNEKTFGEFVNAEISENIISVGGERVHNTSLLIKLFGLIPLRRVEAVVVEDREVFIGGIPLGFAINTKGLIVVGENKVSKKSGKSPFKTGDIITKINGVEVTKPEDIYKLLEQSTGEIIEVVVNRRNKDIQISVIPQYDEVNQEFKLGLWVRNDAQGIGTLTFVTKEGDFGALGHSICDYETGVEIPVQDGGIYLCNLVGINKAEKGKTGEIRCLFSQGKRPNGTIEKNADCGVFGDADNYDKLIDSNLKAQIGSRLTVKLGKAKIISAVSGIREEYDIEIIKTNYQPTASDKSFVFRVIDKRLISLTGGIVQGMSGSPILQNGKVIGAVTHVFLNDATKGYGVYIDWMMNEIA